MNCQTCSRTTTGTGSELRELVNVGITLLFFVPTYFVTMQFVNNAIATFLSIAAAFWLFFFVLGKRATRIVCPECGVNIPTRNDQAGDPPFIYKCPNCGATPEVSKCDECGAPIFCTPDGHTANYAQRDNAETRQEKLAKRQSEVELAGLNLRKAQLDAEIKKLKKQKPTSVKDRLRSKIGSKMELDDEVARIEAELREKFKDNPAELEKALAVLYREARDLI